MMWLKKQLFEPCHSQSNNSGLKHNKSAVKQSHKLKLKNKWRNEWSKSPRAQRLKQSDPSIPSPKFLKLISDPKISRKGASWLFQMRTGHFPTNAYLYRFKRVDSARCPACGHHDENTQHFLLDCPTYSHERWPLIAGKSHKDREFSKLIGNTKNAIPLFNYIQAIGRFVQENARRSEERREEVQGRRQVET